MSTMTVATAVISIIRAVIYLRISKDKASDEHGVINQRGEAERLSAARGYQVGAVYCDNDISAFSGARRPGYEAMMAAAARGEFDVIVLFQTSRLWRTRSERAAGIKILQAAGVSVIATKGPSLDMSTAYGRGMAGLLGEFDTMEVEVKAERQQLAYAAQRDAGIRARRPAALRVRGDRGRSGDAIRWAADALLGGSTVSAVAREWSARGLRPPQAPFGPLPRDAWKRNSVTTILRNPAVAGLRAYTRPERDEDGKTRVVRTIVTDERAEAGAGQWEARGRGTWRALAALLARPAASRPAACGPCSAGWRGAGAATRCTRAPTPPASRSTGATRDPRGPARAALPADDRQRGRGVEKVIIERLGRDDIADLIAPPAPGSSPPLHREAASHPPEPGRDGRRPGARAGDPDADDRRHQAG